MIRGHCRSNLDEFRSSEGWPIVFASVPNKGDYVEREDGRRSLKVCSITHTMKRMDTGYTPDHHNYEPYIIVELNR